MRRLERAVVAKRIILMKNVITPKGQSPKIKGAISNVPVNEIDNICDSLSRTADFNGLALVKL